jgi:hypothetical protein
MSTMIEGEMRDLPVGNRRLVTALIASVLGWSLDLFDLFTLLTSRQRWEVFSFPPRSARFLSLLYTHPLRGCSFAGRKDHMLAAARAIFLHAAHCGHPLIH